MAEFRGLVAKLDELEASLAVAAGGAASSSADDATDDAPLRALEHARALIAEASPRAEVFERRAREADPDRRIYGPGMTQK
eukprot:1459733-Prymnesium_polylepis.1